MKTIISLLLALVSWPVLAEKPVNLPPDGNWEEDVTPVDPVDVPLAGSWCYNVRAPGMYKMISTTERHRMPDHYLTAMPEEDLLKESMRALIMPRVDNKPVYDHSPGFAVVGTGLEALRNAHDIWMRERPAKIELPADTELSLVIRTAGPHMRHSVELLSLQRNYYPHTPHDVGQFFELKYVFPYYTTTREVINLGPGFNFEWAGIALISIGKLPVGKYEVRITRVPYETKIGETLIPIPPEMEDIIVCQSFVFKTVKHD